MNNPVVPLLQAQELDLKSVALQKNASLFTLYYSIGTNLSAQEKVEETKATVAQRAALKEQSDTTAQVADDLLAIAISAKQYQQQLATDMAAYMDKMQSATSAMIELAGEIGSLRSIMTAADYGELSEQGNEVGEVINTAAYKAEELLKMSMDAHVSAAQLSTSVILDSAKSIHSSARNIQQKAAQEFEEATQMLFANEARILQSREAERKSENNFKILNAIYKSSKEAYFLANKRFNVNLEVQVASAESFGVSFSAFSVPVENYYLLLVKEVRKSTFSLDVAEGLLQQNHPCVLTVPGTKKKNLLLDIKNLAGLKDSDGDDITQGISYVVFVLVQPRADYQKKISDFSMLLSAPSPVFELLHVLPKALFKKQEISKGIQGKIIQFKVENSAFGMQHRCIFLPLKNEVLQRVFNRDLAMQVPSYVDARKTAATWEVSVTDDTSDCFGDLLQSGQQYYPLIFSYVDASEACMSALSDYASVPVYTHQ